MEALVIRPLLATVGEMRGRVSAVLLAIVDQAVALRNVPQAARAVRRYGSDRGMCDHCAHCALSGDVEPCASCIIDPIRPHWTPRAEGGGE
jgi:hypothetical protein